MIIGVPKEIKNNENRVALTPSGAYSLVSAGHQVFIEKTPAPAAALRTPNTPPREPGWSGKPPMPGRRSWSLK
ncbi:hypothetical protein HMSSN036_68650 [Paenibacillus macerans]|nr:hypothetical protein HMSSN036_68650 [Paenibacillus macerans]